MSRLLIRLFINAVALWAAAQVVPGIYANTDDLVSLLVVALIFGVVNALIKPLLQFVTCPFYILTLGLFTFVVNALMLMVTSWLSGPNFEVDGFVSALLGGIVISIVSTLLSLFLGGERREEGD